MLSFPHLKRFNGWCWGAVKGIPDAAWTTDTVRAVIFHHRHTFELTLMLLAARTLIRDMCALKLLPLCYAHKKETPYQQREEDSKDLSEVNVWWFYMLDDDPQNLDFMLFCLQWRWRAVKAWLELGELGFFVCLNRNKAGVGKRKTISDRIWNHMWSRGNRKGNQLWS